MIIYFTYGLLLAFFMLPGPLLGDLVFRCPSCTAENLAECPKVTAVCREIVREPGCGCCPVCARMEGELCGVYMPRCSTGLRCYPSTEAELPLQQLIQGLGRCGQKVNVDVIESQGQTNNEVFGTQNPLRRPVIEPRNPHDIAILRDACGRNSRMKPNPNPNPPRLFGGPCEQELHKVLEEIDRMASNDNRGPLENLYMLKFPNCDKDGLYNLKQCNMSTHGQRGECWCVNPLTGIQIPETPKVRGDPNCNQFHEELRVMPTAAASR